MKPRRSLSLAILTVLVALLIETAPCLTQAEQSGAGFQETIGHIFIAGGLNWSVPGSIRLGTQNWELGMLNSQSLGIDKVFQKPPFYSAFGVALLLAPIEGAGFYGAVGLIQPLVWDFQFRLELSGSGSYTGQVYGEILGGLHWGI